MNERRISGGSGPSGRGHGRGSEGRHHSKRPAAREHARGEARLDRERALAELRRFLDLAVREMGLAIDCEISTAALPVAAPAARPQGSPAAASDEEQPDLQPGDLQPGAEPARVNEPEISISFRGEDAELLLERNAELLLALEHVAHRWLRLDPRLHDEVRFDCGDYRSVRLDELKLSARVAAQRVRETGEAFRFNPMSPRERRIIHLELTGAPGVRTMSEGIGDRRQLVIYPAGRGNKDRDR